MATLVWFRDDLRLHDHPALAAAADDPEGVVALYVLDEESERTRPLGGAAKWWLHESLLRLRESLAEKGLPLILRRGPAERVVPEVAAECRADRVLWNRRYGAERHHDASIKHELRSGGVEARSFPGDVLFEPWRIATQDGRPYRVYSAFWRACLAGPSPAAPLAAPESGAAAKRQPPSEQLESWALQPSSPDWARGIAERWSPGEASALRSLHSFLRERAAGYTANRDSPAGRTGSELSPHLRWGEISPRTVWRSALASGADVGGFLSELGWREFAKHTAFHVEDLHRVPMDRRFEAFPWRQPERMQLESWQRGETGFGLVDAGMRELWRTGFMHNRVRMVTASFLTKNLLVDWRVGEAWFWDTLVDADAASNPFNWQWVAGCGADAAPYFRIFNPVAQQQRFDPEERYVTRWAADSSGRPPLVDLRETRSRALAAYESMRRSDRA